MKRITLMLLLAMLAAAALPLSAQQADDVTRYDDIPKSRTDDGAFVLGDPDAPVTLVEFADFMCPHCQDYQSTVHRFIDEYVATGQARFEYRFYPVVHPTYSVFTAQIAECVEVQMDGAFWAAHDLIYDLAADGDIGPDTPETVADALGLNVEKLESCAETASQHETDTVIAQAMGANGTPATMLRLPDGTLGWAYLQDRVRYIGGLPFDVLTAIVEADDHAALLVVPRAPLNDLIDEDADCAVPCWRTITPGETMIGDVADLIRADRQNVEISVDTLEDGTEAVSWKTFDSDLGEPNVVFGETDGTVAAISLFDIADFGLGDVLASQGDPDFALAVPTENGAALLYAVYADQSMIVLGFITSETGLGDETAIVGAQLYSPATMADLLGAPGLVAWDGYDALEEYLGQ